MFTPYIQPVQSQIRGRWIFIVSVLVLAMAAMMALGSMPLQGQLPGQAISLEQVKIPMAFVPNVGQSESGVKFQMQDMGGTLYFKQNEITLVLPASKTELSTLHFQFANASTNVSIISGERLRGVVNYLLGNDLAKWHSSVPTYASITYQQLYLGIDLRYDGVSGNLKGTFTVAPGADPASIQWRHVGATSVKIDQATGDLSILLASSKAPITERAPVAWQNVNGQRISVNARYTLAFDGMASFVLGAYDRSLPLVIDPTLVYSTFLGGSGFESTSGIARDNAGNIYVAGTTNSTDFPTKSPLYSYGGWDDSFIVKLDPTGKDLLFSTYLGGDGDEETTGIAVDGEGNIYVTGTTDSADFPTLNGFQSGCVKTYNVCIEEAFLAKLNSDGSQLLYGTYLGGSMPDNAEAVALESNGIAYIAGTTFSGNFPIKNAYQTTLKGYSDAFVAKFDTTLAGQESLVYSTFLGGSKTEEATAIALDPISGDLVLGGDTLSVDFPTVNPIQANNAGFSDIFLLKLKEDGTVLDFSTYLGGGLNEYTYDLVVDSAGNAYITGETDSQDFPTKAAIQDTNKGLRDAFVVKFNGTTNAIDYSTYLGGNDLDFGYGIAVSGSGNVYVTGNTFSADFPVQDALQVYGGNGDAFVAKLKADGSRLYASFLGGDQADYGEAVVADGGGNAYVAGFTYSADFPTKDAYQDANAGSSDMFIVKVNDEGAGLPPPSPTPGPDLSGSTKTASQQTLPPNGMLTYTINLQNSGDLTATVTVTDPVPAELAFVAGTANENGVYDDTTKTLTWSGIKVAPASTVALEFSVIPAVTVTSPTVVVNKATIAYENKSLIRMTGVMLLPESLPGPMLSAHKSASQRLVAYGETFTYTIKLYNSGTVTATANVTDPVPAQLNYIDGSVDALGAYDDVSKTVTWSAVKVSPGKSVSLSFGVTPAAPVTTPTKVANVAKIVSDEGTLEKRALVVLVPEPATSDTVSPEVHSLAIDDVDVLTDPQVTLHISATDNVEVKWMYLREWQLSSSKPPRWEVVQSSDWVPFAADYPWTLGSSSAVHFVGVWVADAAYNTSQLDRTAMDFASLVKPQTNVAERGFVPYLVYYEQGVEVTAILTPTVGDADLYVWYPGNFRIPDQKSAKQGSATEYVQFVTPEAGTYIFLAYGFTDSTYDFSLTPAGGHIPAAAQQVKGGVAALASAASVKPGGFTAEPVFSQSGIDPLGVSGAVQPPASPNETSNLMGAFKTASQHKLAFGETMTYTIWLYNSGTVTATANVTDPVPAELTYLTGTANHDGAFDETTKTISWLQVKVPPGGGVSLTFQVTPAVDVETPKKVINTANIKYGEKTLQRQTIVVLVPEPTTSDVESPVLHSITIGEKDVLTTMDVTLHISATDNVGVRWMYLREWQLAASPIPHWEIVKNSGWVDFQADYLWTLGSSQGVHFVGVWVADAAYNHSQLNRKALDFASLVQPGATTAKAGMVPYLVHYEKDVDVRASLNLTQGKADLYIWYPGKFSMPDQSTYNQETKEVAFTTPEAGTYLILVVAYSATTYDLNITPGGGTGSVVMMAPVGTGFVGAPLASELFDEPILTQSGLDPLGTNPTVPNGPYVIFAPIVKH